MNSKQDPVIPKRATGSTADPRIMRVLKYRIPFQTSDPQKIGIPEGAIILDAKMQGSEIAMWVNIREGMPIVFHEFYIFGTGQAMPDIPLCHISTIMVGPDVWHIFERTA